MSIMGISGCSSSIGYSLDGRCGGNMVDNWGCRGCNGVDIRYWGGYGVDISGINMDIRFGNDISVNVRFGSNFFMDVGFGKRVHLTGEIIRVHSNGSMDNGGGVGISGMSQRSGGIGMRVGISASNQTVPGMTVV